MENAALINFLVTAKKNTYAIINDVTKIIMEDGGTEVNYQEVINPIIPIEEVYAFVREALKICLLTLRFEVLPTFR